MYDFHYGSKKKILSNTEDFLIFCKRLLPRWVNGIPDSEFLAIYKSLRFIKSSNPIIVETGCGASTLAFFMYCYLNNGKLFSWDTNGSKGSFLKNVILESICYPLKINMTDIWTFIPFNSTDPNIGIPVLKELKHKPSYGFFDSWHTLDHLIGEIDLFVNISKKNFLIGLDDAYYQKKYQNLSYVNILREKIGLTNIKEEKNNQCDYFYLEISNYLKSKGYKLKIEDDYYQKHYKNDIFFKYFSSDRQTMNRLGMEEKSKLKNRFKILKIQK